MTTLVLFIHLIAACVAVGTLLMQDINLMKSGGRRLHLGAIKDLQHAVGIVSVALIALWASGIALIVIGAIKDPAYLSNQKLWAKITVVAVLTANGAILHQYSFPRALSSAGVIGLGPIERSIVASTGAVSTVSWLFACYLGIARPWNHSMPFDAVLFVYLSLLLPGCAVACAYVHGLAAHLQSPQPRRLQRPQAFPDSARLDSRGALLPDPRSRKHTSSA